MSSPLETQPNLADVQRSEGSQDPSQDKETQEPKGLVVNEDQQKAAESRAVEMWTKKIKDAKRRSEGAFKRFRDNESFAAGIQWEGQKTIRYKKYVANLTLKNVNQKVSILYAKNPVAEFQRRKRLNFQLYNGHLESLMPVIQQAAMNPMGFMGLPMESKALVADYVQGLNMEEMIDKIGKTLEITYQWCFDEHDPAMLEQMKSLVRRVIICGVGFVRVGYEQENECMLTSEGVGNEPLETARRAQFILKQIEEGKTDVDTAQLEQLNQLVASLQKTVTNPNYNAEVKDKLVFDFPRPASIIVDPACTCLTGFISAKWIAQEYIMSVDEANAYFETEIPTSGDVKIYADNGTEEKPSKFPGSLEVSVKPKVCIWELINKQTKSHFFICDGYKKYVQKPAELPISVYGFWPVRALTFNDIESEAGLEDTLYPPSDVELMMHPQKEYNRTREALREHRKANAPLYITMKNYLTAEDKAKITAAVPNEVVELEASLPQGMTPDQLVAPKTKVPIDPSVYNTEVYQQDILLTVGAQEANLGPPNPKGTATGQTIAEQSRISGATSNVDDLDNCLSWMARCGGEIILTRFQPETIKRIAGQGAVFPTMPNDREDFLNAIFLTTKAASSGRPNKAVELNNWKVAAPMLQAAGANPQYMVRETLRRLDDNADPEQAFPLVPPQMGQGMQQGQGQGQGRQTQEPHEPGVNTPPQQGRPGPGATGPQQQQGSP